VYGEHAEVFPLGDDHFFPCGDNSPQSQDARLWEKTYIERKRLTGKALVVYWPHTWQYYLPNFKRIGFIR
jgi:Signal peptidase, peptidase S26